MAENVVSLDAHRERAGLPPVPRDGDQAQEQERMDLVAELMDRAYRIGRALESMNLGAFEDPDDEAYVPGHWETVTRELGARSRRLSDAARLLLQRDQWFTLADGWEALHG